MSPEDRQAASNRRPPRESRYEGDDWPSDEAPLYTVCRDCSHDFIAQDDERQCPECEEAQRVFEEQRERAFALQMGRW